MNCPGCNEPMKETQAASSSSRAAMVWECSKCGTKKTVIYAKVASGADWSIIEEKVKKHGATDE